ASALPSTGVSTRRRTAGELAYLDGRIQVTVEHSATGNLWGSAAEDPIGQRQLVIDPPAAGAALRGRLPPARHHHPAALPGCLVDELPPKLGTAALRDGLGQVGVRPHPRHVEVLKHHD